MGLLASLFFWRRSSRPRVLAADGRTFEQISAGTADGNGPAPIWRPVPEDGFDYTPDLAWQSGVTQGSPIFRRFV